MASTASTSPLSASLPVSSPEPLPIPSPSASSASSPRSQDYFAAPTSKRTNLIRRASDAAKSKLQSAQTRLRNRNSMPSAPTPDHNDFNAQHSMPSFLLNGVSMLKVSKNKKSTRTVKLLPEHGQLSWSKKNTEWAYASLENVLELRFGADGKPYRLQFGLSEESQDKWMTVVYISSGEERRIKMLHLVAFEVEVLIAWQKSLTTLVHERRALMNSGYDLAQGSERWNVWLKQCWKMADSSEESKVDFKEVLALCKRLGIAASSTDLQAHFKDADVDHAGFLDFTQFQAFVKRLRSRPEIGTLLSTLTSKQSDLLPLDLFISFMQNTQKSSLPTLELQALYTKYALANPQEGMSSAELANFLLSKDAIAYAPREEIVWQDMSRPLCEYFISSSHNTYLVGNQLKGDSTPEGYIRALQQGCRCVELDVWDGSEGQPVVYHGRTFTSKILLSDALQAIHKYAFVASPYPLILSVEVHCDMPQQAIMAQQLKDILGSALVDKHLDPEGAPDTLPSPEDLKYRILVKAKNLFEVSKNEAVKARSVKVNEESDSETTTTTTTNTESESDLSKGFKKAFRKFRDPANGTTPTVSTPAPTKAPMSFELAALIVYTVGVKCRGFNKKETYAPFHVLSLGERKAAKTIKEARADLLDHNRTHLVRAYPAGTRFTSSNYLPQHLWAVGLQMVAINWQTFDIGAEINAAFFQANGKSGYILKPDILRMKDPASKDKEILASPKKFLLTVSVGRFALIKDSHSMSDASQILSAQQLTRKKSRMDTKLGTENIDGGTITPWVDVQVFAPGVEVSKAPKGRTPPVAGNGFNPVFPTDSSTFELPFEVIGSMLDLVFIRFAVQEGDGDDDEQLGKYCISVAMLQPGYRHLPLYDVLGQQYLFSSLFVKTSIRAV